VIDRFLVLRVSLLDDPAVVVREFCKEEVAMSETRRMADEANRIGQQAQEQVQSGFEAASRSFSEANRGFQAMAAEMTDFSKRRMEDVLQAWQQLLQARNFGDVVDAQTRYAQRAYEAYTSEVSKLGEMCLGTARNAFKPVEETSRRFS
jgi:phasin family protein